MAKYTVVIPVTISVRADGPTEAEHAAMDYIDGLEPTDCIHSIGYHIDDSIEAELEEE